MITINPASSESYYQELKRYFIEQTQRLFHDSKTIVLIGKGCSIKVADNQLVIQQGITSEKDSHHLLSFTRGMNTLERIILLTEDGYISFSALSWIAEQNISFIHLRLYEKEKTISLLEHFDLECVYRGTHRDIREKQEHLSESVKINIMRDIIREKIARQLDFIVQNDQIKNKNRLIQNLAKNLSELEHARSLDHIRLIEANAASLYFSALSKLPLNWLARDKKRIPSEWATIGERSSELSALNNAQHATRPFHALLNYLYATLANRIYLYTMIYGLNPTLGIMHTYNPYRASLVYDIIEPFRPLIDTQLVNLLQSTPLSREVIKQDNSGQCWFIPEYLQYILASVLPDEHTIEQYVKQIVKRIKDA